MEVALMTTWNERCGIAEYGQNLVSSMPGVQFTILDREKWHSTAGVCGSHGILHVNFEPGLFRWLQPEQIMAARASGKKTVMTLHTSHEGNNRDRMTSVFDRVVVHEHTTEGFVHIPHGIVEASVPVKPIEDTDAVGTAGFPFPWKGFHEVAMVARALGRGCTVIAPESPHWDTTAMERVVISAHPWALFIKEWLSAVEVINVLRSCAVNVFAYGGGNFGISGAARLGLASGKPIVLTRCRQFRDLFEYEDEIEFCESQSIREIADAVQRVLSNGKRPRRVLEDQGWGKVGPMYQSVYESLVS